MSMRAVTQIDTMMLAGLSRNVPWADLATQLDDAPTSDVALKASGLNWTVEQAPMSYTSADGVLRYTNQLVNYRSDNNRFLGLVTKNYKVMNNHEAFDFLDFIVDSGNARYNSAGSLKNGQITFVSLELPPTTILDDEYDKYIVVVNDFTGKHAIRVLITDIRVSCMNTLNLALKEANRTFSIRHIGNINEKLQAAKVAMLESQNYTEELKHELTELATVKVSKENVQKLMDKLFPIPDDGLTRKQIANMEYLRNGYNVAMNADDLGNYRGTAFQLVQASADFGMHMRSLRATNESERNFLKLLNGNKYLDITYDFCKSLSN